MFDGYKTYIVAGLSLVYVAIGLPMGFLDFAQAAQIVQVALVAAGIRHAIN